MGIRIPGLLVLKLGPGEMKQWGQAAQLVTSAWGTQRGFSEQCGWRWWTGHSMWLATFRTSADKNFPTLGPFSLMCHQKWTVPDRAYPWGTLRRATMSCRNILTSQSGRPPGWLWSTQCAPWGWPLARNNELHQQWWSQRGSPLHSSWLLKKRVNDSARALERPPSSSAFCKDCNFNFFSVLKKLNMWFSNLPSLLDHMYLLYNYIYIVFI